MTADLALGAVLTIAGLAARVVITMAAAGSAVDQHYWLLIARAYREQRRLPVRLPGKYLMEDETQAYPPLFGWLLARLGTPCRRWLTNGIEVVTVFAIAGLLISLDASTGAIVLALGVYASAPVLVVYNAQLTPRVLGDFFLFTALASQLAAAILVTAPIASAGLWIISAMLVALMIMTHKMTLQLFLVLLPFWTVALGTWLVPASAIAGVGIFVALVGPSFAWYQWRAHWDIVRFWTRHWKFLGAHQFRHSPIYGSAASDRSSRFHAPGLRGAMHHGRLVVSYLPVALCLPVASAWSGAWPPDWLIVWLAGTYAWALATLYVPWLKGLGGGHLYIFNAVAPTAIYAALLPQTPEVLMVLALGGGLTFISLVMAFRVVRSRSTVRDANFDTALDALAQEAPGRVAVFPLQAAEAVAAQTHHAVLWGGHGYGFRQLEGFFPVLVRPLSSFLAAYHVGWVLWDEKFWQDGEACLRAEGVVAERSVHRFGTWILARTRWAGHKDSRPQEALMALSDPAVVIPSSANEKSCAP